MKKSTKTATGVTAAGIAAAGAALAAGYYFYGSKKAKEHRGQAAKWAKDMKREVMKQAKGLGKMSADDFAKIVETVAATYTEVKKTDLDKAANELKSNWKKVKQELLESGPSMAHGAGSRMRRVAPKRAKKAVTKKRKKAAKK